MLDRDILLAREAERAEGEMDFRFLKDIVLLSLAVGMGMSMSMMIARWSEMLRLKLEKVMYGETSGADQIQDVTTAVGGKVDVLCEVEAV